jgi:dolichol-phosphate mannosyltransferase
VAVVDDASTDATPTIVDRLGVPLIRRPRRGGAGAAIRTAYAWAREQRYDICVILSGNDKDSPAEIPRLVEPIVLGLADVVQGSRYMRDGCHTNMPAYRLVASKFLHPWLFSLAAGQRMSDTTNGFRAVRLAVLDDPAMHLSQKWLDQYELEPYLLLKAIRLGYSVREVPVTKTYPVQLRNYTKMRPVLDWWGICKPIVLLGCGLQK